VIQELVKNSPKYKQFFQKNVRLIESMKMSASGQGQSESVRRQQQQILQQTVNLIKEDPTQQKDQGSSMGGLTLNLGSVGSDFWAKSSKKGG
jgi:hypothetical protein